MNRDDVIRMVREANRYASNQTNDSHDWQEIRDERFAALVAAAEREACAAICDRFQARGMQPAECAGAIRARGQE